MAAPDGPWDIRGRTVLLTGGTAGIGYATARDLVGRGARVIITGRDADRGNEAAAVLASDRSDASVTFLQADHATVGGNQRLARDVAVHTTGLDVLVNNVGGLTDTRRETADGYEWTLAMNFVGPYALTMQLLPLLLAAAPARCVNVVSAAYKLWKRDPFDDVQATRAFVGGDVYAHTKLLNVLFGLALADRLADERITVNLVHPGVTWTQMTRSQTVETMPSWRWVWPVVRMIQRHGSPDKAADGSRTWRPLRKRGPIPARISNAAGVPGGCRLGNWTTPRRSGGGSSARNSWIRRRPRWCRRMMGRCRSRHGRAAGSLTRTAASALRPSTV